MIQRGLAALQRPKGSVGLRPYALQRRLPRVMPGSVPGGNHWARITELYGTGRSGAVSSGRVEPAGQWRWRRSGGGLEIVDRLASEPTLKAYHLLPVQG